MAIDFTASPELFAWFLTTNFSFRRFLNDGWLIDSLFTTVLLFRRAQNIKRNNPPCKRQEAAHASALCRRGYLVSFASEITAECRDREDGVLLLLFHLLLRRLPWHLFTRWCSVLLKSITFEKGPKTMRISHFGTKETSQTLQLSVSSDVSWKK